MDPISLGLTGAGVLSGLFGGGGQRKLQKQQLQLDRDRLREQQRQFNTQHAFDQGKYADDRFQGVLQAQGAQTAEAAKMVGQNMLNPSRHQLIASLMSRFGGGGQNMGQILQQLQSSPRVRPTTDYASVINQLRRPMPLPGTAGGQRDPSALVSLLGQRFGF